MVEELKRMDDERLDQLIESLKQHPGGFANWCIMAPELLSVLIDLKGYRRNQTIPSKIPRGGLTYAEKMTLEWLSRPDGRRYGECRWKTLALNTLVNTGLASYSRTPPSDYDCVSLTEAGRKMVAELKNETA